MTGPLLPALRKIPALLSAGRLDTAHQLTRIVSMERNIGLPVRAGLMGAAAYYLFLSKGFGEAASIPDVVLEFVRRLMFGYLALNLAASVVLFFMRKLGWGWMRWVVFTLSLMDGFFLAAVTLIAGGFDSGLYWLFFGLLVRNAISLPVAALQIILNLSVCVFYGAMAVVDVAFLQGEAATESAVLTEPFILRLALLLLTAACCYGIQVIYDRNLHAQEESREFHTRQEQLAAAGRLAAEIAHQLKNPLAIINNAAFNLQRSAARAEPAAAGQLRIIREEVERSDRIITQIMDYAQLAEGHVERVDVAETVERAIAQVFPGELEPGVRIETSFAPGLPRLLMQRRHLDDILVNLLKNAREAMPADGHIRVTADEAADRLILVVEDNGPGVAGELRERVFEPYFTTKPKGSGLGLAIVKHNTELYGGTVRVDSGLGNGARLVLEFPTRITPAP
ncbi:MAG TPA: ATP-binding protein [Verrucomicrobiae bacterium]|jgi:signal transduction histidine kinase